MSDFIERLKIEIEELEKKTLKLDAFLATETFKNLEDIHKYLLIKQVTSMQEYLEILKLRLGLLIK